VLFGGMLKLAAIAGIDRPNDEMTSAILLTPERKSTFTPTPKS